MPEVSVIINCFNGGKYLREALDSVYAQTFDDWEIVFWDNASTDNTRDIATSYGTKLRYFRGNTTVSLGQARNLAFEQAQGKYVAILDADDIWLPHKLERQLPLFEQDSRTALTFTDCTFFDADGDQYNLFQAVRPKRGDVFGDLLGKNFISSETMIFRSDCLAGIGTLFNGDFTMVMDYDLSLKVAYQYRLDYVDQVLSKWRMHPQSQGNEKSFLFPLELQTMIQDLLVSYPDIVEGYKEQLALFDKSLAYSQAVNQWRTGRRAEARRYLSSHLNDKKFFLIYLATWMASHSCFERGKHVWRRTLARIPRTNYRTRHTDIGRESHRI